MNIRLLLWALVALSCLSGCKKAQVSIGNGTTVTPGSREEQKLYNVSYAKQSACQMDVYLPAGRSMNTPLVIMLHGSDWTSGDKSGMAGWQDMFLVSQIATVNLNFRHADTVDIHCDSIMSDIRRAVDYIQTKSLEWNIKKTGYIMMGMHSGGHLAMLYSYKYDQGQAISGLMALAAPSDLTDDIYLSAMITSGNIDALQALTGVAYTVGSAVPAAYQTISPRFYTKKVPSLLIHGTADATVPYTQADVLHTILNANQYYNRLVGVEAAGHDLNLSVPATKQMLFMELKSWIFQFGI